MKKPVLAFLCIALCLSLLISCSTDISDNSSAVPSETDNTSAEISADDSSDLSRPWYETSVPDTYVSDSPFGPSDTESSYPDDSSSVPDTVLGVYDDLPLLSGDKFNSDCKSHRIVYTKVSALSAVNCVPHPELGITAIYDGSVTRFFDSNGPYCFALSGKYLLPCCGDTFISGDASNYNLRYSVTITRADDGTVTYKTGSHESHLEFPSAVAFYSEFDKKAYTLDNSGETPVLYRCSDDTLTVCRSYQTDLSVIESWFKNGSLELNDSDLGKYGIVRNGEIVVPFEYDLITAPVNSAKGVYLAVKEGKYYYISSNGNILTPDGFTCGAVPVENRAWVFSDTKGYVIAFN